MYAIFNDQSFNNTLTSDFVSFEQLGPECPSMGLGICCAEMNIFIILMLSTMGKIFSRKHFEIFFYPSQKTRLDILCKLSGDNLHEMSNPVFLEK